MYASLRKRSTINDWVSVGKLQVEPAFNEFIEEELLPAIDLDAASFWSGLESIIDDLTPINHELLRKRDELQRQIDDWHRERRGREWHHEEYLAFLRRIGYLQEQGAPFEIATEGVDPEIAAIAGPQLVVPLNNARFADVNGDGVLDVVSGSPDFDERSPTIRGVVMQSSAMRRGFSMTRFP